VPAGAGFNTFGASNTSVPAATTGAGFNTFGASKTGASAASSGFPAGSQGIPFGSNTATSTGTSAPFAFGQSNSSVPNSSGPQIFGNTSMIGAPQAGSSFSGFGTGVSQNTQASGFGNNNGFGGFGGSKGSAGTFPQSGASQLGGNSMYIQNSNIGTIPSMPGDLGMGGGGGFNIGASGDDKNKANRRKLKAKRP
jgi:hypothetical protein